jgi:LmbE family N-acetylglucosaminyl deacetylase
VAGLRGGVGLKSHMLRRSPGRYFTLLAMAGLLALALLFVLETVRRQGLYWYDVRQDYVYDFDGGLHASVAVDVQHGTLALPEPRDREELAVVVLRLEARPSGWWFEPCVVVETVVAASRQCFERGARGTRYLLLPQRSDEAGATVTFRGEHVQVPDQQAELLHFKAPRLEGTRLLVLAPHPDDAEIAAFGLYSTHTAFVATLTAGNYVDGLYAGVDPDPQRQDALRGELRTWDSLVVPLMGGVPFERVVNLGYLTHSLRAYHRAEHSGEALDAAFAAPPARYRQGAVQALLGGREGEANWGSVVADLAALLASVRPDVVVSPHPALDAAPDHQYTTVALLEALERTGDRSTTLLLYTNHHVWAEHYPFGPSDAEMTLPPWFGEGRFAGLHSQPLDADLQQRKLFALEAMHDLRGPPVRLVGGPARVFADRLAQAFALVRRDPLGDYSYFRRAVRPNELFFVFPPGSRHQLAAAE